MRRAYWLLIFGAFLALTIYVYKLETSGQLKLSLL